MHLRRCSDVALDRTTEAYTVVFGSVLVVHETNWKRRCTRGYTGKRWGF